MHFIHIRRRILKIKPSVVVNLNLCNDDDDDDKPVSLIVDASGLTENCRLPSQTIWKMV